MPVDTNGKVGIRGIIQPLVNMLTFWSNTDFELVWSSTWTNLLRSSQVPESG